MMNTAPFCLFARYAPRLVLRAGLVLAFCLALGSPVLKADDREAGEKLMEGHERAEEMLRRGEILPFARVLEILRPQIQGEIVKTEFEKEDGVWVYEIKFIAPGGYVREIYADPKTGAIIKTEDEE